MKPQLILVVCQRLNVLVAKLACSDERLDHEVEVPFVSLYRTDEADEAFTTSCLYNDLFLIETVEVDRWQVITSFKQCESTIGAHL